MKLAEPFLTDPKQIKAWLDSMGVNGWKITEDGVVDVEGTVYLGEKLGSLTKLPVRFGKVGGNFYCSHNRIVSLEGSPNEVGGNFHCSFTKLVSLEGAPEKVVGDFFCHSSQLLSLKGAPKEVGWDFYCRNNQLVSLDGAPERVGGDFHCNCNQLVSLEGAPKEVGGEFWCHNNRLVDFKGMEDVSIVGTLVVTNTTSDSQSNVFVSLEGLPKELYSRVVGLDVQAILELEKQRAANLLVAKVEELSSDVELG